MNIYSIITTVLWIVFGFFIYYFKTKTNLLEKAKDAINFAETEFTESKSGGAKMEFAVKYLYDLVPEPLKIVFTEETIQGIIQVAFDKIQEFAELQLDKVFKKEEKPENITNEEAKG